MLCSDWLDNNLILSNGKQLQTTNYVLNRLRDQKDYPDKFEVNKHNIPEKSIKA